MTHTPIDLKNVVCPQCKAEFRLMWNDYTKMGLAGEYFPVTLCLRGCPSVGIYSVSIRCPHCNYEEEL